MKTVKKIKFNKAAIVLATSIALVSPFASAYDLNVIQSTTTQPEVATKLENDQENKPITIYFLNGIFNTETQSQTSATALFLRLKYNSEFTNLVKDSRITLKTLYNPTDPWGGDLFELQAQANIQKQALASTEKRLMDETAHENLDAADLEAMRQAIFQQEMYRTNQLYLAQRYSWFNFIHKAGNRAIGHYHQLAKEVKKSLLNGERVVIVAHSQGNYVAQGLYAELSNDHDALVKKLVKERLYVVGVANVAGTTPTKNYITNSEDKAVYFWHGIQGGKPMVANFKPIFANGYSLNGLTYAQRQNDSQNHGFIETYLSARFNNQKNLVPHSPEIVEKVENGQSSTSIYQRVVDKVMAGIDFIQKS